MAKREDLSDLSRSTEAWSKFALANSDPFIPKDPFPFMSLPQEGRILSVGGRVWHYQKLGLPIALNGDTGTGKTTLSKYAAGRDETHLSVINAGPHTNRTTEGILTKASQDRNGNYVDLPGLLPQAALYKGRIILEEASLIRPNNLSTFNLIIQGNPDTFGTHYGTVNLDWGDLLFMISGNFHAKNPDFDAASLYRFPWIEIERQRGEVSKEIDKNRALKELGREVKSDEKYIPMELEPYTPSPETLDALVIFANNLFHDLNDFADLNRGSIGGNGSILSWREWFKKALERWREEEIVDPTSLARYLHGPRWKEASPVPQSTNLRAILVYHPKITKLDYRDMLVDIYVNPAIAVSPTPLNPAARAYKLGMEAIIDDHLERYHDKIKQSLK